MAGTPSTPTQNFIGVEISTSTTDNPANYNVAPDNLLLDEAKLSAGTMPLDVRKSSTCIIYQQPSPHYNVEHCCSILLDVAKRSAGETPCRWTFLRGELKDRVGLLLNPTIFSVQEKILR